MLAVVIRLVTTYHIRFEDPREQAMGFAALTRQGPCTASKLVYGPLQLLPRCL